jgi:ERF superfamily
MGAALTYARRYALFTLVGIAGEDDLDAPDLNAPNAPTSETEKPASKKLGRPNGGQAHSNQSFRADASAKSISGSSKPILDPEPSAALRDQLAVELGEINSTEEAANWAHRVLGVKNSLTAADAACIEEAFRAKVAVFASDTADESQASQETERSQIQRRSGWRKRQRRSTAIDKTELVLPATRRIRDPEHVKSVAKQPCLVCGRRPADAHHLRFAQNRALSRKVSDEFIVPLCRGHHREVHHSGDEASWWKKAGIDPTRTARALWLETHPLATISDQTHSEGPTSVASTSDLRNASHGRRPRKRRPNDETNPIEKAAISQ